MTSVFYNANDANDSTSANNQRKKRQAENGQTKNLYIAFENNGSETAKLTFTAITSTDKINLRFTTVTSTDQVKLRFTAVTSADEVSSTTAVINIALYFIEIDIKPLTEDNGCFLQAYF